jgi:hypothetical protein
VKRAWLSFAPGTEFMKLLKPVSCQWETGRGNEKSLTALGDARVFRLSDSGSTPLASTTLCLKTSVFRLYKARTALNLVQKITKFSAVLNILEEKKLLFYCITASSFGVPTIFIALLKL